MVEIDPLALAACAAIYLVGIGGYFVGLNPTILTSLTTPLKWAWDDFRAFLKRVFKAK